MDSEPCENYSTAKLEVESDSDSVKNVSQSMHNASRKRQKYDWTPEKTLKLIDLWEKNCKELWDTKHQDYRSRNIRAEKHEYLAGVFGTSVEEITRKLHNLRSQWNNELRKIKRWRRQRASGGAGGSGGSGGEVSLVGSSGWEFFDAMSFLGTEATFNDPADPLVVDGVNFALAEFQANEEEEFGHARQNQDSLSIEFVESPRPTTTPRTRQPRVAASAPPPLPPHALPNLWPEEPSPRIRPSVNADEWQIFGDFVASELRMLRSDESRKRLKRMIQKAILQVGEDEDYAMFNGRIKQED